MPTLAELNQQDSLPTLLPNDRLVRLRAQSQEIGRSRKALIDTAARRRGRAGRAGCRATGARQVRREGDGGRVVSQSRPDVPLGFAVEAEPQLAARKEQIGHVPGDERQRRERLADYFAILREWDQRLTQNESQEVPEFHQP